MGGSITKAAGQIARGGAAVFSGGLSEGINAASGGKIYNKLGVSGGPMGAITGQVGRLFGFQGNPDAQNLAAAPGGQSPTELLANTGGAPVLAQIVMGVSPKDALAGFMGIQSENWDNYVSSLSPKDASALLATQKQLETIQTNTDIRNKAVQAVINDFPNIAGKVAQARASSGQEFDEVTKGAINQALQGTAAKYAAGGALSSGAMNEATARVGNENALNKLNYMNMGGDRTQQLELAGYNSRLAEVNALRDFQNTMLGRASELGFSANQANLGRIQQGGIANAGFQNQQTMQNQANENATNNAMFGALGSLGGSLIGGAMLSNTMKPNLPSIPSYGGGGYGRGSGIDTSMYAPPKWG